MGGRSLGLHETITGSLCCPFIWVLLLPHHTATVMCCQLWELVVVPCLMVPMETLPGSFCCLCFLTIDTLFFRNCWRDWVEITSKYLNLHLHSSVQISSFQQYKKIYGYFKCIFIQLPSWLTERSKPIIYEVVSVQKSCSTNNYRNNLKKPHFLFNTHCRTKIHKKMSPHHGANKTYGSLWVRNPRTSQSTTWKINQKNPKELVIFLKVWLKCFDQRRRNFSNFLVGK